MKENLLLYLLMAGMCFSGSALTIAVKIQGETQTSHDVKFKHYFLQTFVMFLGELTCLAIYYVKKAIRKEKMMQTSFYFANESHSLDKSSNVSSDALHPLSKTTRKWKIYILILPALCDILSSTLLFLSLDLLPAGTYQMLRVIQVIFIAIFSKLFFNRNYNIRHYACLLFVVVGIVLIGLGQLISDDCNHDSDSHVVIIWYGFVLLPVAYIFSSTQFILEEKFLIKYEIEPLEVIGWEGFWGTIFSIPFILMFSFIPCSGKNFFQSVCTQYNPPDKTYNFEDIPKAFSQFGEKPILILLTGISYFSVILFNYFAVLIIKKASAMHKCLVENFRAIVVYIFFIASNQAFGVKEEFYWAQIVGFVIVFIATIYYAELRTTDIDPNTNGAGGETANLRNNENLSAADNNQQYVPAKAQQPRRIDFW